MDFRIKWIAERTLHFLGVENIELFNNLMDSKDGELYEKMNNFINMPYQGSEKTLETVIFYVNRTYYDKLVEVEKEITEWRIVPPTVKIITPPQSSKKKAKAKDKAAKPKPKPNGKKKEEENVTSELETTKYITDINEENKEEDPTGPNNVPINVTDQNIETEAAPASIPPSLDPEVDGTIEYYTLKRFVPMMLKLPKLEGFFGSCIPNDMDENKKFVYFIKILQDPIPLPKSEHYTTLSMPKYFIVGSCNGNILKSLLSTLNQAYVYFFKPEDINEHTESQENNFIQPSTYYRAAANYYLENICDGIRLKFFSNLSDMKQPANTALQKETPIMTTKIKDIENDLKALMKETARLNENAEKETYFQLPNIAELNDKNISSESLAGNKSLVTSLEGAVKNWCVVIKTCIDASNVKNTSIEGPLNEYEFWKTQYGDLLTLLEEIQSPPVQQIIDILKLAQSPIFTKFKEKEDKLLLQYKLSFDNIKLLSMPLRYFRIVTESSDFKIVGDSISGLMYGLRMLWMLSKFYNTDEQMVPFLERISNCLCKKIEIYLAVETLFDKPYTDINILARNASVMLKKWKLFYMSTRQQIEELGKGKRWEFDGRKLFHRTDYLANISDDLAKVARILIEFENILGAEIKTILEDQNEIEIIINSVHQLIYPIQTVDFSVFIPDNKENWDVIMNDFNKDVCILENRIKLFFNEIFENLRSSVETLEMLLRSVKISTRPSIHSELMKKFDCIWDQFFKEIVIAENTFTLNKANPPLLNNHPPISGAILWSWTLRKKISNSWNILKNITEMNQSEKQSSTSIYYNSFSKSIETYEQSKCNAWLETAYPIITSAMKNTLLILINIKPAFRHTKKPSMYSNKMKKTSNATKMIIKVNPKLSTGSLVHNRFYDDGYEVKLNFDERYFHIIDEMGILESLGFKFSSDMKQHRVQPDKIHIEIEILEEIISQYRGLIGNLNAFGEKLMHYHIYEFEKCLLPGIERIKWSSLGIMNFINKCQSGVHVLLSKFKFNTTIHYEIESLLKKLENHSLFIVSKKYVEPSPSEKKIKPCKIFFASIEKSRIFEILSMQQIYDKIGKILIKLEYAILGTDTGFSNVMQNVYEHWENEINQKLIKVIIFNLQLFNNILKTNKGIFQVNAILQATNIVMFPDLLEINNILRCDLDDLLISYKLFTRWKSGSCLTCKSILENDNDYYNITFFDNISDEKKIQDYVSLVLNTMKRITTDADQYVKRWSKYKGLWSYNKQSSCEKYVQRHHDIKRIDERFLFYENVLNELNEHVKFHNIGPIQINLEPIINQIQKHAMEWRNTLGECLISMTKLKMEEFSYIILRLQNNLNSRIKKISDFKLVTLTADQIKHMTTGAEVLYTSIQETFYMLRSHNIEILEADVQKAQFLQRDWCNLYLSCLHRIEKMGAIKNHFACETSTDVKCFSEFVKGFTKQFFEHGPGMVGDNLDNGLILMGEYSQMFENIEIQKNILSNTEYLFDGEPTDYSEFEQAKNDYKGLESIFLIYTNLKKVKNELSDILWAKLDINVIKANEENTRKEFRVLPSHIKKMPCGESLKMKMDDLKKMIPLIEALKHEAIKERHWNEIMSIAGKTFDISENIFTLGNVFDLELHKFQTSGENSIDSIILRAIKELSIERDLSALKEKWSNIKFELIEHFKDGICRGYILSSYEDLIILLDENRVNLQILLTSRFIGEYLPIVQEWEEKLSTVAEIVDQWLITQQKWLYLESIFVGTDIRDKLPLETQKFDEIDQTFIGIMKTAAEKPLILECCSIPGLLNEFIKICENLDKCQKTIFDYIDSKRRLFPRFFFLSNDELLSIFGNSEPSGIQEHINKMFDNMSEINFITGHNNKLVAGGLISNENEILEYKNNVLLECAIEEWMNQVVNEMNCSNKYHTKKAIFEFGKNMHNNRIKWVWENLGMVSLASNAVWWTAETEYAFERLNNNEPNAMKEFLNKLNENLKEFVYKAREELSPNEYKKLKAIITIDVHSRDIIENFVMNHIISKEQFEWESQLRFYWVQEIDDLKIHQCTGTFDYGYEYMGLNGRLIITPLTDRIYLTITQALTMHLGTAPAGPAGTGKTETVKDLAKALALLCVVTNCGENLNFKMIAQLFMGLCSSGAWGCFDEFNRIDISVLSVITTQLQSIRSSLMMNLTEFMFSGILTKINHNVGIFITMNPGYAGRTELPESIKVFFRPVMCIVPDFEIICQIYLFSDGFISAKTLARKITVLYKLANDQLSKQSHYEWGVRALTALLRMSAHLKRISPGDSEETVLMKALRDINQPKFIVDDASLFLSLVKDIFPGLEYPKDSNLSLNKTLNLVIENEGYTLIPYQIEKINQLKKTLLTQFSVMLVGPSGGGKTTIIDLLVCLQNFTGEHTNLTTLNPKAITVKELYGVQDFITREWVDGLFSYIFRKVNKIPNNGAKQYILFDGDVDTLWIENMNSVMDDNKLLTLANGERIRLLPHCSLLFEVGDLTYASPATISRAGMIYVDPKSFGHEPYWQRWLASRNNAEERKFFEQQFNDIVPNLIDYMSTGIFAMKKRKPFKLIVPFTPLNMVTQLCSIIDGLLPKKENDERYDLDIVQCSFIISLYYSFGSIILKEDIIDFDTFVKKNSSLIIFEDTFENKATTQNLPTAYPTLYDYFLNIDEKLWYAWEWLIPTYVHDREKSFYDILVPTVDTLRINWIIGVMKETMRPILLTGDTGTSKTAMITHFLQNLDVDTNVIMKMNFSSKTTSQDVQTTLDSCLEKRSKNTYGPAMGKKLIVFIDDMNMPRKDNYGTQMPIAFLKLLLEKNGYYERDQEFNWKTIKDMYILGSMAKGGGGRNNVDARFSSKFSIINVHFPHESTIKRIYLSILSGHLETFKKSVQDVAEKIIDMTLDLFKIVTVNFLPTPSRFHYIFNLRDLSRIFSGLCLTHPNLFLEPKFFIRVWRNEFCRVMCDRMITIEDQTVLHDHIAETIIKNFADQPDTNDSGEQPRKSVISNTATESDTINEGMSDEGMEEETTEISSELTIEEYILRDPLLFGDFRNALNGETRFYEDLLDHDAVYYLFQEILEDYNDNVGKLPLILFEDCLEHLTRIHRVLQIQQNHMLIVGLGSTGKKSMLKLAAYAAGAHVFEILTSHGYNEHAFKEDLKRLYNILIVENKKTVFLISASQIIDENFLDLINNMLVNGMISTLFDHEEKDMLINKVRDVALKNVVSHKSNYIWDYICNLCEKNLHIVFVSPPGNLLRQRCFNFPGLINYTTVDWLFPWSKSALLAVANSYLADVPNLPEQHREQTVQHIIYVHETVMEYISEYKLHLKRYNYATPHHYINYLKQFLSILDAKEKSITAESKKIEDGILKIDEANLEINRWNAQLIVQKKSLLEQTADCTKLQAKVMEGKEKAENKKAIASQKSVELVEQNEIILRNKREAEEALAAAMPALNNARLALEGLEKSDITEIRSFATPPEDVQIVGECILIIRGYEEINWKNAKGMMSDPNFLKTLLEINYDDVTNNQVKLVKAHMKKIKKIEMMQQVSKAGYGLLIFLNNVLEYYAVYKEVKPKKLKLLELEATYKKLTSELEKLNEEIEKMTRELEILNNEYEENMQMEQEIQFLTEEMTKRLSAVDKLLTGLSSEKGRWIEELKRFQLEKTKLIGSSLLSSAFFNYSAPFTFEFRCRMIYDDWMNDIQQRKIPIFTPYKIETSLSSDLEINVWNSYGLPLDDFSVQNGILTVYSNFYPLCIDPQSQAVNWIKNMEEDNNLKVITLNNSNYLKQIESSIRFGNPLLIEDVPEDINPILYQLFEKDIKEVLGQKIIKLGTLEVEFNPNFRLYITTKLSNPRLDPIIYSKLIVINYLVTFSCLEEQLLRIVVCNENPDLDTQRKTLIKENASNKTLLNEMENKILYELSNATGTLLDNEDLLIVLEKTKETVAEIKEKIILGSKTSAEISLLCNSYRPVAERGALLFFTILDMSHVNYMYQYSLQTYFDIFLRSIRSMTDQVDLDEKLIKMIKKSTYDIYEYCCMGIFEKHKLLFSFQISMSLEKKKNNITQSQIDIFIKGSTSIEKSKTSSPIKWLSDEKWELIEIISEKFVNYQSLPKDIVKENKKWEEWYNHEKLEVITFPAGYSDKLSPFEKLLLLKCFRIDRLQSAVRNYVTYILGVQYNVPPSLRMEHLYRQTSALNFVIFILTVGSDPMNNITLLAKSHDISDENFKYLSLGQGQEPIAIDLLNIAMERGQWIVLQNCHLLPKFLKQLEVIVNTTIDPNPDFRLWITSEPTEKFPVCLLQKGIKVIIEPPNGLQMNLRNIYLNIEEDQLENCGHPNYKKIIYSLAFFHAVIQERKKYGKIGWNIKYDFNETDFNICMQLLQCYLQKIETKNEIPWHTIKFLFVEIMYGGRIIDSFDRRTLNTYADEYFGSFLFDNYQEFYFFKNESINFTIPPNTTKEGYIKYINDLPIFSSPEIFGLHTNAEISYYTESIKQIWNNLITMQSEADLSATTEKREDIVLGITNDIISKIPPKFDLNKIKKQFEMDITPVSIVLLQELEKFNILTKTMVKTLNNLQKALIGEIEMSSSLENIFNSLYNGQLPKEWEHVIPESNKTLANWMAQFIERSKQYEIWATKEEPIVMWLSGLHNPESFLAAHMQMACRLLTWPLEKCIQITEVTVCTDPGEIEERPENSCFIHGLYLEGARWDLDDKCLKITHPKVLMTELPILKIIPIKQEYAHKANVLETPVYVTSMRRNAMGKGFVFESQLTTYEHNSKWILQGVCLIMNANE